METPAHTGLDIHFDSHTALGGNGPSNEGSLSDNDNLENFSVDEQTTRKDTGRWSNNNTVASSGKTRTSTRLSSIKTTAATAISKTGTWTHEIVGLIIGIAAVTGIAIVLAYFDGRAIPDRPLNITLSALIVSLATIANANLAAPIQSSISQLKWIRYNTRRTPLTDMETYDKASRGTLGSIKLLLTLRGGVSGSFGASLTIIALALGSFVQQIASYKLHTVHSTEGAAVPRALKYIGYLPGKSSPMGLCQFCP